MSVDIGDAAEESLFLKKKKIHGKIVLYYIIRVWNFKSHSSINRLLLNNLHFTQNNTSYLRVFVSSTKIVLNEAKAESTFVCYLKSACLNESVTVSKRFVRG